MTYEETVNSGETFKTEDFLKLLRTGFYSDIDGYSTILKNTKIIREHVYMNDFLKLYGTKFLNTSTHITWFKRGFIR